MTNRIAVPLGAAVTLFGCLFARDLLLIFAYREYEPKFGPSFNVTIALVVDAAVSAVVGLAVAGVRAVGKLRSAAVIMCVVGLFGLGLWASASRAGKSWNARRAVRYVYWRNFEATKPLQNLKAFEHPRLQLILHGFTQMHTDPWGRPFQYELVPDHALDHPHRRNWDIAWVFWSNGPDGRDDGAEKHDDIDVTNAGL